MPDIKEAILATLTYFDNFRYPLTQQEVFSFLPHACMEKELEAGLHQLIAAGTVFRLQEYYSLSNDMALASRRKEGYNRAVTLIQTAEKVAGLLACFPYVRGIALSGSLSKHYADEHSDIDFFIITAGNRLWLARSFTHIAKKISFLVKKQHFFCMNYYIDEYCPQITEQNVFTATEVVTLIPLKGMPAFITFNQANTWARTFLPNHPMPAVPVTAWRTPVISRCIEWLLNNAAGNWLDNRLMQVTVKRWTAKKQAGKRNDHGMVMSMLSGKHYSKPDPTLFQERIVHNYCKRAREIIHAAKGSWLQPVHPDTTEQ